MLRKLSRMLEKEFVALLRCPHSGAPLLLSPDGTQLLCPQSHMAYPIVHNVPILKQESAVPYTEEDTAAETEQ